MDWIVQFEEKKEKEEEERIIEESRREKLKSEYDQEAAARAEALKLVKRKS